MSTLPLEVHEVLEEEYEAIHGPIGGRDLYYADSDIVDSAWAESILDRCEVDGGGTNLQVRLNNLIDGDRAELQKLNESPAITDAGVTILRAAAQYAGEDSKKFNRRVLDEALTGAVRPLRHARLAQLYDDLHRLDEAKARTALCISGGGIRSATFALGVIQGLASAGLLEKFHYLSTVSGGGYIGSWLSSWARRHGEGMPGVQKELMSSDTAISGTRDATTKMPNRGTKEYPKLRIDPEAAPIRHLREYSNYLSPQLGITSGDTWSLAALYLRNLLLNLLVLVPVLACLLAIPRYFAWLLHNVGDHGNPARLLDWTIVFLAIGFAYIGASRPVKQGRSDESVRKFSPNAKFIVLCVLPLVAAATTLALFWAALPTTLTTVTPADFLGMSTSSHLELQAGAALAALKGHWPRLLVMFLGSMMLVPFAFYYLRYGAASAAERRAGITKQGGGHFAKKIIGEALAVLVAMLTTAGLLFLAAWKFFPEPLRETTDLTFVPPYLRSFHDASPMAQLFIVFAVPVVLAIFFVQASVFVGLSGSVNEDDDREWWGRAGAWLLFAAAIVAALGLISVFGPVLLYKAPVILSSIGGISGIAAALVGFSGKTAANDKQQAGSSAGASAASGIASAVAVPLFVVVALAAISLGTTWLFQRFDPPAADESEVAALQSFTSQSTRNDPADTSVKLESSKMPVTSLPEARGFAHLETIQKTRGVFVLGLIGAALVAVVLSFFVGVNKFSMHALYRNRLIRAYLGASRYTRDPDRFTGFDEHDNLQMHELRPDLVWTNTLGDGDELAKRLIAFPPGTLATTVEERIAAEIWKRVRFGANELKTKGCQSADVRDELVLALNDILTRTDLPALANGNPEGRPDVRANRDFLVANHFDIGKEQRRGPMHVINTALNLVGGDKLAWQERKAESFSVTPLHSGSPYLGYRDTQQYGGEEGISIGTAVTISGAAASPNMGYNSSVPMAFLLTLFNVRLGWWLGNPGVAGRTSYTERNPSSNLWLLFNEMIGRTSDQFKYVYLSDGGHFENLGIYEMVMRRCRFIVVSDGGCDPTYSYDDLGNAIRKIRTDFGVPIDINDVFMFPRHDDGTPREGSYVAKATIRYSAIDGKEAKDGVLIYIKPGLYTGDFFPRDVYNYAHTSREFPHEPTSDQFFSESQFESYRALGRHAVNVICGNYEKTGEPYATTYSSVAEFARLVKPAAQMKEDGAKKIAEAINGLARTSLVRPSPASPQTPC